MPRRAPTTSLGMFNEPMPSRKRGLGAADVASSPAKRTRSSDVGKDIKTTPTKSGYFKKPRKNTDEEESQDATSDSELSEEDEASAYEEDKNGAESSSQGASEDEEDDDADFDETPKNKGRKGSKNATPSSVKSSKGKELWRPGVKTGLGPGTKVIIKKPQARPAGKTPYRDDTIHPNTLLFLKNLAANNDREWLKMHDPDYRASLNDWNTFVEQLSSKIMELDETIPELPVKDLTFRIYRDIRFSPDPTPYKTHFSAAWSRTGRKGPFACYYVQIKPGGSFVGGGLWMPEAASLALMRRNLDRHSQQIKAVLMNDGIRKEMLGVTARDEAKAVKAFVSKSSDNALKTKPKGYDADNPNIALLRLRNFTLGQKLGDNEVVGPKGIDRIAAVIAHMVPFITYLNRVVMPDEEDDDSSSDSEGDSEAGESDDSASGEA